MNVPAIPLLQRGTSRARKPHWRALALAICAIAVTGMTGFAHADDPLPTRVGRVSDVAGELFLAPADRPDGWTPVAQNYPVASGDNLWVGNGGRAEIDFGPGLLRLAGDTNIHLSRLDDHELAVFASQGRLALRVRVLEPGDSARIDTPNAQIAILRSGSYRIDVSEDREHTYLVVREGEANVLTAGAVQQVLPGQTATIDGLDARYADVRNGFGTDGFDAWVESRDRYYASARTGVYVSPQMVGAADLDLYGTWTQQPEYGAVWYPSDVPADWAPYRNGYWVEVGAYGPTWVDYAPWGYAPFHYGRWAYIGGRWGWCPGSYVARPVWAPALVAWTGGAGWSVSASVGAPVYGWVPLAWGEPYRPWWRGCSYNCWARYNRPYAVNVTVARYNSPPPTRYVNWSRPGGITAVSSTAFMERKPVQANLVRVSGNVVATAPVMTQAPAIRNDPSGIGIRRPQGAPPPASTFQRTLAQPAPAPGGAGNLLRGGAPASEPNAMRAVPGARSIAPSTGMVRQSPSATPSPGAGSVRQAPGAAPAQPAVTSAPPSHSPANTMRGAGSPAQAGAPSYRQAPQAGAPSYRQAPQAATVGPAIRSDAPVTQPMQRSMPQTGATPPSNATRSSRSQGIPIPVQPAPVPQQQPQSAPMVRMAPPQAPHVAPAPQPAPQQRAQPVAPPAPAAPANAQQGRDGGGNVSRGDRSRDFPGGGGERGSR